MHAFLIRGRGIDLQRFIQCCMQSFGSFRHIPPLGKVCQVSDYYSCLHTNPLKWRYSQRNVYLLKIGAESFGDGSQDICKDTESNLGPFFGF